MLKVENVSKIFKVAAGELSAVDDVSFTVQKGETMGIVGESGCGKSTLGRMLLRLREPSGGRVWFNGIDIMALSKQEMREMRRYMQIIFQDPYASLNPRLSIAQSIEEPLKAFKICRNGAGRRERVVSLMKMAGLGERAYHAYPHEFDGGMRQRVVIARALALRPRFIVCDEPVSALDVSARAQILNLMMDLQKELNLTLVFISHDLSVVRHIAVNVGVMYLGRLVEIGPKRAIFKTPAHPYTRALLSAIPRVNTGKPGKKIILKGETGSSINPGPRCRFAPRCPFANADCFSRDIELREVASGHFVACSRYEETRDAPFVYPA